MVRLVGSRTRLGLGVNPGSDAATKFEESPVFAKFLKAPSIELADSSTVLRVVLSPLGMPSSKS